MKDKLEEIFDLYPVKFNNEEWISHIFNTSGYQEKKEVLIKNLDEESIRIVEGFLNEAFIPKGNYYQINNNYCSYD